MAFLLLMPLFGMIVSDAPQPLPPSIPTDAPAEPGGVTQSDGFAQLLDLVFLSPLTAGISGPVRDDLSNDTSTDSSMTLLQPPFFHAAVINAEQIHDGAGAAAVLIETSMLSGALPVSGAVCVAVPNQKHAVGRLFPDDIDHAGNTNADDGTADLACDILAACNQPGGTAAPGIATETDRVAEPAALPACQSAIQSSDGGYTAQKGWTNISYAGNSPENNLIASTIVAPSESALVARLEELHQARPDSEPRTNELPSVDAVLDGMVPESAVNAGENGAIALSPDAMISVPAGVVAEITHASNIAMTALSSAMPAAMEPERSPTAALVNHSGIESALDFNPASKPSAMSVQAQESAAGETLAHDRVLTAGMKTAADGAAIFRSHADGKVQISPDRPVAHEAEPAMIKVATAEMKAGGNATGDESDANLDWLGSDGNSGSEAAARHTPESTRWASGSMIATNGLHQIQAREQSADVSSQTWRPLVDRLAADIVGHLRVGKQEAVLQLDPPELGKVEVNLRIEDGKLHARIVADASDAKELLESHLPELHQALRAGQFEVVEVRVSHGSGQTASQDFARNQHQSHPRHDGHDQNFGSAPADGGLRAEGRSTQSRSSEHGRVSMWA